ncbi:MAG: hypothetical protein UZ21_OP11001000658 [Microgenomates bacterium OLB22]|nr:MAG: hypothetical protein UZ21_OP11001000658 [Microgenomates bacterium OLB22]
MTHSMLLASTYSFATGGVTYAVGGVCRPGC